MYAALGKGWREGDSTTQIAYDVARSNPDWHFRISKNVIIGKINRRRAKYPDSPDWAKRRETPRGPRKFPKPRPIRTERFQASYAQGPKPPQNIGKGTGDKYGMIAGGYLSDPAAAQKPQHFKDAFKPDDKVAAKDLLQLRRGECRWPVDVEGSTLQMFCARPCAGNTYCDKHGGAHGGRR